MRRILMAAVCIVGLSGSAFAVDQATEQQVRDSAAKWEKLINKKDTATLANEYSANAIRVTPVAAFHGRSAIQKDLEETSNIFSDITIKTSTVQSTPKGTIFCDGEWTGNMKTKDGKVVPVKGVWGVTGEIEDGRLLHHMDVYTMAPAE